MKFLKIPLLVGVLSSASGAAQTDFKTLDSLAGTFKTENYATPNELALALVKNGSTDTEKTRLIFSWIAKTIRYDWQKYMNLKKGDGTFTVPYGMTLAEKYKQFADKTYRGSRGICMDYSLLFQDMCKTVGLECEYISGQTRHSNGFFRTWESHAWNAVKLNGKWQLIDATWASGYIHNGQFHRKFSDGYFCTKPELFILDHFPEQDVWQLLPNPISKQDFKHQLRLNYAFGEWAFDDFEPKKGELTQSPDDTTPIRFHFVHKPPPYIALRVGSKMLPVHRVDEPNGWTTLTFIRSGSRDVMVGFGRTMSRFVEIVNFD